MARQYAAAPLAHANQLPATSKIVKRRWSLTSLTHVSGAIASVQTFNFTTRIDDNADAKRILLASPAVDLRRQPGRPHIMWLSVVQQDLKHNHLTLHEAPDMPHNRPL